MHPVPRPSFSDPSVQPPAPEDNSRTLPAPLTLLVGREAEARTACTLLLGSDTRLLTVTGPPGIGKTQLALRIAQLMEGRFPDGVYYVPLANIAEPEMVVPCIARALGLDDMDERTGFARLKEHLQGMQSLLVLDNFEQVDKAAAAVAGLMEGAPGVRVLATSRTLLDIYGERTLPVSALSLPRPGDEGDLLKLAQYESVALFVARAVAARPDFTLSETNASAVAEICRLLEGVPLALELAAARIRASTSHAVLERLRSQPLHFLKGGAHNAPLRQQTLREAIGWSYNLLNAGEQQALRRLAVFVGGCTLEGATAILGDESISHPQTSNSEIVLELLESLVAKSLLSVEDVGAETRFNMLHTIREYALERLEHENAGEAEAVRLAHVAYFVAMAESAKHGLYSAEQAHWLDLLELEHDNIRAALRWLLLQGSNDSEEARRSAIEMGLRIAQSLWLFWEIRGYLSEGYRWLLPLLENEASKDYPALRAKALVVAGRLALIMGDLMAARRLYAESLELSRSCSDPISASFALTAMGHLAVFVGDIEEAEPLYRESLAVRRKLGETRWVIHSLVSLGDLCSFTGRYEEAVRLFSESLSLAEERGDKNAVGRLCIARGHLLSRQGNHAAAEALYREGIARFSELKSRQGKAECVAGLAEIAYRRRSLEEAAILLGWVYSVFHSVGLRWDLTFHNECEAIVADLKMILGADEFARLEAQGVAMDDDNIVSIYDGDGAGPQTAGVAVEVPARPEERMPIPITLAQQRANPWGLTLREMEVLRLVAAGMTNAEAAERLIVSPHTVNMHLRSIYIKLGVSNRSAATRYAVERNIV